MKGGSNSQVIMSIMSREWKQTSGFLYSHTTKWIELHIYMLFLTMKSYLLIISYTPHPVTSPPSLGWRLRNKARATTGLIQAACYSV
jgi:hypothetical protein